MFDQDVWTKKHQKYVEEMCHETDDVGCGDEDGDGKSGSTNLASDPCFTLMRGDEFEYKFIAGEG